MHLAQIEVKSVGINETMSMAIIIADTLILESLNNCFLGYHSLFFKCKLPFFQASTLAINIIRVLLFPLSYM